MDELQNKEKAFRANLIAALVYIILEVRQLQIIYNSYSVASLNTKIQICGIAAQWIFWVIFLMWGKQKWLLSISLVIPDVVAIPDLLKILIVIRDADRVILYIFLRKAACVLVSISFLALLLCSQKLREKIWVLPTIFQTFSMLMELCYYSCYPIPIKTVMVSIVFSILTGIAYFFTAIWITYPEGLPKKQLVALTYEEKVEESRMKFCSHCGKEIMDAAVVCPHCGCAVAPLNTVSDEPSTGLNVLSFFIPLVGLVLYLVYHDKTPKRANAIGKWALIGVGVGVALWILNVILISSML